MNKRTLSVLVTMLVSSSYANGTASSTSDNADTKSNPATARLVDEIITAKTIKRVEPKFPIVAARNGHEGWVEISYVVDKDGNVVEPFVTDSLGHNSFKSVALTAVKQWQFEPAMRNGEAIESCQNQVRMEFSLTNQKLSRSFYSFYKSTNALLQENKLEQAKQELSDTRFKNDSNLLEQSYLSMLWADYFQKTNQPRKQLKQLYNVTNNVKHLYKSDRFGPEVHLYNLQQRFIAELNTQQFANALDTFEGITKFDTPTAKTIITNFQPYVDQILALKETSKAIIHDGTISENGRWHHRLYKHGFSLSDVSGNLSRLDIRCNGHRVTYVPNPNNYWDIPASWGSCHLYIEGDKGANFKLVESNKA